MSNIIRSTFENQEIRTVMIDGEAWWVARDLVAALGDSNTNDAIIKHCRGVAKHYPMNLMRAIDFKTTLHFSRTLQPLVRLFFFY